MSLFRFQETGARALADNSRLYLADEPGLGKSRTVLLAAHLAGVDALHILAPAVVREHWKREYDELRREHADVRFSLCVESYQRYVVSEAARARFLWARPHNAALALDEAHFLKHETSHRTKLILGTTDGVATRGWFKHVWPLSGTPMPRNPAEMYPVLRALWPERLKARGVSSYVNFLERFCQFRWTDHGPKVYGLKNVDDLRSLLHGVMLRRLTRDVMPDLPPLRWGVVSLTPLPGRSVDDLEASLSREQVEAIYRGELPPVDENLARYRHAVGDAKAFAAAELVGDELDADPKAKRVVFAYHRSVLDALQTLLAKYGVERIDGSTPQDARSSAIDAFQNNAESRVFLGQLQACATGLDGLQRATNHAVLVEPDWATDVNAQAGKRVSRIGSTLPGLARMLSLAGTLDDAIVRNHYREVQMVQTALNEGGA